MANQLPAVVVIRVTTSRKIATTPSALTVIKSGIIRECVLKTSSVVFARRKATWPSTASTLGMAVPLPSGALSLSNPEDSVAPQWNVLLKPLRLRIQVLFKMTLPILRASLALLMYGFWTQKVPLSPRILLLLNRLQRFRLQLVFLSSRVTNPPRLPRLPCLEFRIAFWLN